MRHAVALLSFALVASPLGAQEPDSASMRLLEQAAARVKGVRMNPSPLRLTIGDTAEVTLTLVDAEGRAVTAKMPDGSDSPPPFRVRAPGLAMVGRTPDGKFRVTANQGVTGAKVAVFVPPFPRSPTSTPEFVEYDLPITAAEPKTVRVELGKPRHAAYTGTSIPLGVTVWREKSRWPETDPNVTWSSSDPRVAWVSDRGVVTFIRDGRVKIAAQHGGVRSEHTFRVLNNPARRLVLTTDARGAVRTGDAVRLRTQVWGSGGQPLLDARPNYTVSEIASVARATARSEGPGAAIYDDYFVASRPGVYTVISELAGTADRQTINVRPRDVRVEAKLVSHVPLPKFGTSEVMVFEGKDGRDYAYLGTWGNGDRVYVFDVTDPKSPKLTDSVMTDARVINDIRVDRLKAPSIAVFTREGASDRKNGIVILDVTTPAHPKVLSEFKETVAGGVHDVWIYRNRVYLTNDGTGDMHIIDIRDPKNPKESGRWSSGSPGRYIHDLIFEDDIGYLSYWDDGMIIIDVGGAGKGGNLDEPKFVSQFKYGPHGSTHHVFRYRNYAFISDELFGSEADGAHPNGPGGYVHIVDLSDLSNPVEVARYEVPEAGAHNTWVEDDKLYVAYYQGGLRVVDVSGTLRGNLYDQGREIAWYHTAGAEGKAQTPNQAMAWSPQPYKGNVFVSDLNSGMWVVKVPPKSGLTP